MKMETKLKKIKKRLSLQEKDKLYLWHPFTQMKDWQKEDLLMIRRGKGCYLEDTKGRCYLDGVSSLWCNVHGHQVPEIDDAIRDQLGKVAHSTFLGLTHPSAIELAERLIQIVPKGLTRVFYSDSGSEAVEIALKMAFQYWQHKGQKGKRKFVRLANAYHGDTIGSVSVGGIDLFHQIYGPLLFECLEARPPFYYRWEEGATQVVSLKKSLDELEGLFKTHYDEIAALVMEPLIQGAAGMLDQPAGYLSAVRKLSKQYNILLIFDEVATGFGRTGKMFAAEHERVTPDLMAVAKGMTGGYLPLAATLATEEIYSAFLGRYEEFKTFFHGHTYTANPLACRAAIASLELFKKNNVLHHVRRRAAQMAEEWPRFKKLPLVGDIRQAGLMAGIELMRDPQKKIAFEPKDQIGVQVIQKTRRKGAILRPLGSVIVLMPPLAISATELKALLNITFESISEVGADPRIRR